jgi:hypothetical protein
LLQFNLKKNIFRGIYLCFEFIRFNYVFKIEECIKILNAQFYIFIFVFKLLYIYNNSNLIAKYDIFNGCFLVRHFKILSTHRYKKEEK